MKPEPHFVARACFPSKTNFHVQQTLGHKNIQKTVVYVHLIDLETDDYDSATANRVEHARRLIEAGFEYVCTHNKIMLLRKRKQMKVAYY